MLNKALVVKFVGLALLTFHPSNAFSSWEKVSSDLASGWVKVDCDIGSGWRRCAEIKPLPSVTCYYDYDNFTYWHTQYWDSDPYDLHWIVRGFIDNESAFIYSDSGSLPNVLFFVKDGVKYTRGELKHTGNKNVSLYSICY